MSFKGAERAKSVQLRFLNILTCKKCADKLYAAQCDEIPPASQCGMCGVVRTQATVFMP